MMEERRMRVDSNPIGALEEQFLATAYVAHPYRRPDVGWESEISQVTATEAEAFHKKYYVPANIVIAVVGDVKAEDAMPLLTRYFGPIPAAPKPEPMTTDFSANCGGSTVVIASGLGPPGMGPKYFVSSGIASAAFTSPTTAITMFAGT